MSEYKPIPNFEGYSINKEGFVVSFKYGYGKVLKYRTMRDGYVYYMLRLNNKDRLIARHRLLAMTFIPNKDLKAEINHIDGNKQNNDLSNLEWVSRSENIIHAFKTGLNKSKGGTHYHSKLILDLQTGIFYDTVYEAATAKGLGFSNLGKQLTGRSNHKNRINKTGLIWAK